MMKLLVVSVVLVVCLAVPALAGSVSMPELYLDCEPVWFGDPYNYWIGWESWWTNDSWDFQNVDSVHITGAWDLSGITSPSSDVWVMVGLVPHDDWVSSPWRWYAEGKYLNGAGVYEISALEGDYYYANTVDYAGEYEGFTSAYEYWGGPASGREGGKPGMAPATTTYPTFDFDLRLQPSGSAGGNNNLAVDGGGGIYGYDSGGVFELGGGANAYDGTGYVYDDDLSNAHLYARVCIITSESHAYDEDYVWDPQWAKLTGGSGITVTVPSEAEGGWDGDYESEWITPEPATMILFALGLAGLGAKLRKRKDS